MHVYVLTMNWKLNVSRTHQNPQDSEKFFKFITMHKLTARIIQCIVPHKLIVLDLLNFCYHKLHDCTISQGCVEQSTCLPVLTALDAFDI